jgi:hypothetical protein
MTENTGLCVMVICKVQSRSHNSHINSAEIELGPSRLEASLVIITRSTSAPLYEQFWGGRTDLVLLVQHLTWKTAKLLSVLFENVIMIFRLKIHFRVHKSLPLSKLIQSPQLNHVSLRSILKSS